MIVKVDVDNCKMTIADGFLSSGWEEVWLVLYNDSLLAWYQRPGTGSLSGGVRLARNPDLIAAGQSTARVPDKPRLPPGVTMGQVCHHNERML